MIVRKSSTAAMLVFSLVGFAVNGKLKADQSRPILSLTGHRDRIQSIAYSPDGRWIATAAWDGTARLWDAKTGKEVRRLDMPAPRDFRPAHLMQVLFSRDNRWMIVAQQAMPNEVGVMVWNRRSGEKVHEFRNAGTGSVAISPDGKRIACGGYGVIRFYDLASGEAIREIRTPQTRIEGLTFSSDGQTLISTGPLPRPQQERRRLGFMPAVVRVWDAATGKERRCGLTGLLAGVLGPNQLALSPDGRTLALGSSLSEVATGGHRTRVIGTTLRNDICAVAFSPDGRTVATGSMDGTARLWDLPSGKEIARFGQELPEFAGRGWVLAIAFSPDGRTLACGGLDKIIALWDVSKVTRRQRKSIERSSAELETDWKDLAGDAAKGYAAMARLVCSSARSIAFLEKKLLAIKPVDAQRMAQLIAELDDEQFQVRERAAKELEALADRVASALQKALAGKPSLEVRRRLRMLLNRLDGASPSAATMREIRAVEALESIGNAEARRLLDKLAAGPTELRLTQEAKLAAKRLAEPRP
jgi:WD40 repeat protein